MTRWSMSSLLMITRRIQLSNSRWSLTRCIPASSIISSSNNKLLPNRWFLKNLKSLNLILMLWYKSKMMERVTNSLIQSLKFLLVVLTSNYPRLILCSISSSTARLSLLSFLKISIPVNLEVLDSCSSKMNQLHKILLTINATQISLVEKLI